MMPLEHDHPVDAQRVAAARAGVLSVTDAGRLAGLLGMLADPVRSRVLFALSAAGELCVGDLALALEVTEDQVSYALKMLRLAGLVSFRKDGRMVFYRSEEHTSELQSRVDLVCRLLLEKKSSASVGIDWCTR